MIGSATTNPILVFDWGDTLMKVFPNASGPMASWPQVAEVEGVVVALEQLLGYYHMAVATNAADSDAQQVWKALRRVGLAEYFKAVFNAGEVGSRKPDPAFFRQIELVLDRPPQQMILVGDDYVVDMLGAMTAGWHAIWYNPACQAAPGLLPLHDAEIQHMQDLPGTLTRPLLPGYLTCLAWLSGQKTPYHILSHIQLVAAIAYQLAVWLIAAGEPVDPVLTHRGALLHDLAKYDSIRQRSQNAAENDHAEMASRLLNARGQPELAEIANRHMPYVDPADPRRPETWEQKIVHFADKLAEGAQLVSVEQRVEALRDRYPQHASELAGSLPNLLAIRQSICDRLGLTPDEMMARLRQGLGGIIAPRTG